MEFIICDAQTRHIIQLEQIERECFLCPWTLDQLSSQLSDCNHELLTALSVSDEVLGYAGMSHVLDEGYISNVAVRPAYRRQGMAEALVRALMSKARELGLSFLTLEVRQSNASAIALYDKLGFLPVGLRKGYYERPREDAILMTLFLNRGKDSENTRV